MGGKTILVTVIVGALGIAVAVAGFVAEAKRPKNQVVFDYYGPECSNPGSPSLVLAITAIVALVIARSIITATTGGCCSCCLPINNGPAVFARVCIVISWITSSAAVIQFIVGAKLISRDMIEMDENGDLSCYSLRPGVFAAAGIMGLVSVLLGLIYYLIYVLSARLTTEKSSANLEPEKPPVTAIKKLTMSQRQ